MENKQARKNIATRYLMVQTYLKYGERLGFGENPVNFAHRVWLRDREGVPDTEIAKFQKNIVIQIKKIKEDEPYQSLLNGDASNEFIDNVLNMYEIVREEW
ncbi:MAG: hypothetical protein ACFFD4_07795 [Candidatus Odinarchaeota archaeon]